MSTPDNGECLLYISMFLFCPSARAMKAPRNLPRLLWTLLLGMTTVPALPAQVPDAASAGERIHQLRELASRRHIKPYELLRNSAGEYPSERTVFRDVKTGTVLWKLSHNPGYNL